MDQSKLAAYLFLIANKLNPIFIIIHRFLISFSFGFFLMLALQSLLKISWYFCNGNLIWPQLQSMQCAQNKAWIQKSFTNIILKLHIVNRNPKPPLLRPMRMRLENWRCLANQLLFITRICSRIKYLLHNLLYLILTTIVNSRWDRPKSVFIDFVFLLPRLTQPPIYGWQMVVKFT